MHLHSPQTCHYTFLFACKWYPWWITHIYHFWNLQFQIKLIASRGHKIILYTEMVHKADIKTRFHLTALVHTLRWLLLPKFFMDPFCLLQFISTSLEIRLLSFLGDIYKNAEQATHSPVQKWSFAKLCKCIVWWCVYTNKHNYHPAELTKMVFK